MQTNKAIDILNFIRNKADSQTLIIFDVDNVLSIPKDLAIQQNWRITDRIREYYDDEKKYNENIDKLVDLICLQAERCPVENDMSQVLNYIKQRSINTIALTHCSYNIVPVQYNSKYKNWADWRSDFLEKIGIDFSVLSKISSNKINLQHGKLYNGIILTDGEAKGECLNSFLSSVNFKPSKVIFIDDHKSNLQSVEDTCNKLKIAFHGIHYTKAVEFEQNNTPYFDREILQTRVLIEKNNWLSDEVADNDLIF